MKKKLDIQALRDGFCRQYNRLYESGNADPEYHTAMLVGDHLVTSGNEAAVQLARLRRDGITSDRECAAFAFALREMGGVTW